MTPTRATPTAPPATGRACAHCGTPRRRHADLAATDAHLAPYGICPRWTRPERPLLLRWAAAVLYGAARALRALAWALAPRP